MRALKLLLGIMLIPVVAAGVLAAGRLGLDLAGELPAKITLEVVCLAAGLVLAVVAFGSLPRPNLGYVVGHELTHGLVGLLMGARIHRLQVGSRGGRIHLSKTNVAITLSPYVVPLYTLAVAGAYALASLFVDLSGWRPLLWGLIGLSWGLHTLFTVKVLLQPQPDLEAHGVLFSLTIILLGNLLLVTLAVVWLDLVSWTQAGAAWGGGLRQVARTLTGLVSSARPQ